MKKCKPFFSIIGAVVVVAAAVTAVIVFKDEIKDAVAELKEAFCPKKWIETDEYDDFDDI